MKTLIATTAALLMLAAPAFAGNGGHMPGGGSSSSANSSSSSHASNANRNVNNNNEKYQAPGLGGIGLTSTGACPIGSIGAGLSIPWGGINFATTKGDKECRNAYLMQQAGFGRKVLQQYLVNEVPEIRRAVFPNQK